MTLAVDAFNLAADRRGMGRYVRSALYGMQALGEEAVLVVRDREASVALQRELDYPLIEPKDLRAGRFGAVWYPWNGVRFTPHARSIVTIYDTFAFLFPNRNAIARWREQRPIERAARTADRITTISRWSRDHIVQAFGVPLDRVSVVPPVVEPFWRPVNGSFEHEYFLFVGGPDERKNAPLLFGAFEDAFEDGGPELVVAGQLNDSDERALSAMRAAKRRVRPGDSELRELYSNAIAVAVPSTAEGYGLPVLEAMACGAPVIASDAAALPEAAGGAALLVPSSDRLAWRDALRRVYVDADLRDKLRQAGLARTSELDPVGPARSLVTLTRELAP